MDELPYTRAELLAMDGRGAYAWRLSELAQQLQFARGPLHRKRLVRALHKVRGNFRRAFPGYMLPA